MHTAAFQREWAHAVGLLKPWWAHTKAAAWVVATAVGQVGDHGIASVCTPPTPTRAVVLQAGWVHTVALRREWAVTVGLLKPWWAHTKAGAWVVATVVGQVGDHGIASVCTHPPLPARSCFRLGGCTRLRFNASGRTRLDC
ncbi:hypothetical protein GCM10009531_76330 [Actinoplanes capillaceus]